MKLDGFVAPTHPPKAADSEVDENRMAGDRDESDEDDGGDLED
jgi:hypothetical protein